MTRVAIVQPAQPKYRIPVFRELAKRPQLDCVTVYYGHDSNLPSVEPDGFNAYPCRILSIGMGRLTVFWQHAMWKQACKKNTDVLILPWDLHYVSIVPALLRARANGVRTILWGHGYSKREGAVRKRLRNALIRLADAAMTYNQKAADALVAAGVPAAKVFVAPNALDQEPIRTASQHWQSRPDELDAFRKEHQLSPGPVLLYVSRLLPENRVELLLHATARLIADHPNLRTVIIGAGPDSERLKAISRELALQDHVLCLGAIYEEISIAPWFMSATLFVYPTNIGLSLLHAFGYGLPAITNDRLGSHGPEIEALTHGSNGLLYADGSLPDLTSKVSAMLMNKSAIDSFGAVAYETTANTFSIDAMVNGIHNAILNRYSQISREEDE